MVEENGMLFALGLDHESRDVEKGKTTMFSLLDAGNPTTGRQGVLTLDFVE